MKNQQSRSKPTYPKQIRHYRTISYINIHYFFSRFSTELCSNDYADCEHGLRIVKPQDVMKRLGRRTARLFAVYFSAFRREHPRLSNRFTDTIDQTYDACSYMADKDFQDAIADAVDEFLGIRPEADIF